MQLHPPRVEVGDDAVEVDSESHRPTLRRTGARPAKRSIGLLLVIAAACGGDSGGNAERSYVIQLGVDDAEDRYRFVATGDVDVQVGDEVTFELANTGTLIHDLQVVDPDGNRVAYAPPIAPGADAAITARFEEAGFFRLNCLVDDHLIAHDMQTFFEVTDPEG